jgi:hypothetical protein
LVAIASALKSPETKGLNRLLLVFGVLVDRAAYFADPESKLPVIKIKGDQTHCELESNPTKGFDIFPELD